MIERLDDPAAAAEWCRRVRESGRSLGFVPTMGGLHPGHQTLARRAVRENRVACASVFVNPLQFGEARDFELYPRDFARDALLLDETGCDMVFTGTLESFFPDALDGHGRALPEQRTEPGPAAEGLEGAGRPGHFEGVATIVARLFDVVEPTRAYFGEKDFQQLLVVRDLARRRGGPAIVGCPIAREPSGLAWSSRNERLSSDERRRAAAIHAGLAEARAAYRAGERDAALLCARARAPMEASALEVEYVAVRDPEAWSAADPERAGSGAVALAAARVGAVRLIDNLRLDES